MTRESLDIHKQIKEIERFLKKNLFFVLTGITIVVVAGAIVFNYKKTSKVKKVKTEKTEQLQKETVKEQVHTVKKGEHLWMIAEKYYGSGYNAIDIAKANNIKNPNIIYVGQKLIIPNVKPRKPTVGKVATGAKTEKRKTSITHYTVKKGDNLWKIAVNVYGDGYAWVKIARANRLRNPGLIFPGQRLRIP